MQTSYHVAQGVIVLCAVLIAAVTDLRTGRIPNLLTLPLIGLGMMMHGITRGAAGLLGVAVAIGVTGCVPWILFRVTEGRAIGGGDVKLLAGLGAVVGCMVGLEIQLLSFVLLCVFALSRLAFQGVLIRVLSNALFLLLNPVLPSRLRRTLAPHALTEMRMGPAIACATCVVVVYEQLGRGLAWLA